MAAESSYLDLVNAAEENLAPYAKKSFESFSRTFVNGEELFKHYQDRWSRPEGQATISKRTPAQLERDKILYSYGMRKQTEKYHVLYNGDRRIVRNFITHTMRVAQVTRAICRALNLNTDFAEAIALGTKVGALPFVHASKGAVSKWAIQKIIKLDRDAVKLDREAQSTKKAKGAAQKQISMTFMETSLPNWFENLSTPELKKKVIDMMPIAGGKGIEAAYSSGQQGYWQLCVNPYSLESRKNSFMPETMYGIWRHSRGLPDGPNSFHHAFTDPKGTSLSIASSHCTYEGIVVRYADDITWIIENLNDADAASQLNGKASIYEKLKGEIDNIDDYPDTFIAALKSAETGRLYNYFINDFIGSAQNALQKLGDGAQWRLALRDNFSNDGLIGLSPYASKALDEMKVFLDDHVFNETRVANRFRMLETVSHSCMDMLYMGKLDTLIRFVNERAILDRWNDETKKIALSRIDDDLFRIQLAINIFADMSDQEIYDFVGIQIL